MPLAKPTDTTRPRILALIADQAGSARLRAAFGEECVDTGTQPELIAASRNSGVELVIVSPRDRTGRSLGTSVAAIRASRRSPPVYVYADRSVESVRELVPLVRAGARGVILSNVDDDAVSLRTLLARGTLHHVLESISVAVHHGVSARHVPLVLHCLDHLAAPISAADFARRLRVSRRTLTAWASKAGSRGVRSLTSKCRVLAAIEMMRCTDRAIEQVAHELQFGSSAHLHNTIRRYTGLRPRGAACYDAEYWARRFFSAPRDSALDARAGRLPLVERNLPHAEWPIGPNDAILPPTIQAPA